MTAAEAASIVGISRDTLYRRIARNKAWHLVDETGHWNFEAIVPLMPKGRQRPGAKPKRARQAKTRGD